MNDLPRCDKCRHWRSADEHDWTSAAVGFRVCDAVRARWKIEDDASEKRSQSFQEIRQNALKASRAYVQDGSEYYAELVTGPDFFCALFEEGSAA